MGMTLTNDYFLPPLPLFMQRALRMMASQPQTQAQNGQLSNMNISSNLPFPGQQGGQSQPQGQIQQQQLRPPSQPQPQPQPQSQQRDFNTYPYSNAQYNLARQYLSRDPSSDIAQNLLKKHGNNNQLALLNDFITMSGPNFPNPQPQQQQSQQPQQQQQRLTQLLPGEMLQQQYQQSLQAAAGGQIQQQQPPRIPVNVGLNGTIQPNMTAQRNAQFAQMRSGVPQQQQPSQQQQQQQQQLAMQQQTQQRLSSGQIQPNQPQSFQNQLQAMQQLAGQGLQDLPGRGVDAKQIEQVGRCLFS